MKTKAIYFHAGCGICVSAEQGLVDALDRDLFEVERVHLGEQRERIAEAERYGLTSVPALVIGTEVFHINHGADLAALK